MERMENEVYISLDDAQRLVADIMPRRHVEGDMTDFERGVTYAGSVIWGALRKCRQIDIGKDDP